MVFWIWSFVHFSLVAHIDDETHIFGDLLKNAVIKNENTWTMLIDRGIDVIFSISEHTQIEFHADHRLPVLKRSLFFFNFILSRLVGLMDHKTKIFQIW